MADNLPAPRDERGIERKKREQEASSSRRASSGQKVSGKSGGCLLPVSLVGLALLTGGLTVWSWVAGYMVL